MRIILIWLFFACILVVNSDGAENSEDNPIDYDNLRISNNRFNVLRNYHSISPDNDQTNPSTREGKITNYIGKPLVPLPQQTFSRKPSHKMMSQSDLMPAQDPSDRQIQRDYIQTGTSKLSASMSGCDWMPLRNFKNVSLETGELIVRDGDEQPCYLMSIRGFIKLNDNAYFPLRNYQLRPRFKKFILTGKPNDGANAHLTPMNCTVITLNSKSGPRFRYSPLQRASIPFKEEITILVDCGYLVLRIYGDGLYLTLGSLSFYQSPSISRKTNMRRNSKSREELKFATPMEKEHLVFSSYDEKTVAPLIMMPLTSRYTCQNRVILTGNNSVQLNLDQFEIQRLALSPAKELDTSAKFTKISGDAESSSRYDEKISYRPVSETARFFRKRSLQRIKRDVSTGVQFPSVIKCPSPTSPTFTLNSMMDIKGLNDTVSRMVADKWMTSSSSPNTSNSFGFIDMDINIASILYLLICVTTYYIIISTN